MRFEAAGNILQMVFLGVTAASTLTSALALIGLQQYALPMLVFGLVSTAIFAFGYVELGIYNRQNREKKDRGENFAKPQNRIDDELIARGIHAAREGRPLTQDERDAVDEELDEAFRKYRNGIKVE